MAREQMKLFETAREEQLIKLKIQEEKKMSEKAKNVILSLESFSRNEEDIFNNDNNADEVDFDY